MSALVSNADQRATPIFATLFWAAQPTSGIVESSNCKFGEEVHRHEESN